MPKDAAGTGPVSIEVPAVADIVVVGGGAGGAPAAARLAEATSAHVLLLEAGPDYGSFAGGRWPREILDASTLATSHDWGYTSEDQFADRAIHFERARVLGGCTAHNGAIQIRGHRLDYDHWVELGNSGWDTDGMLPLFVEAETRLGVWTYDREDLTPFQATFLQAAPEAGLPILRTINDLDENEGAAPETVNIRDGVRWNTAFAYLDPVRHLPNLTICGNALVDRLEVRGTRAVSAHICTSDGRTDVRADQFVLAAGAYGTPSILQRSGIGDAAHLRALGIEPVVAAPVGENLHDQAFISIELAGSADLRRRMTAFADARRWAPDEQVIMKARSDAATEAFDLHVFPWSPPDDSTGLRRWFLGGACLTPRSRGTVAIQSRDPECQPRIDNAFLTDREGQDLAALRSLLSLLRRLTAAPGARYLVGNEIGPSATARSRDEIEEFIRSRVSHYWHPQGSCKMGPDDDPQAVCTPRGLVRGLENVRVSDCSLVPQAPRGFPMLPTIAIAEKICRWMIEDGAAA